MLDNDPAHGMVIQASSRISRINLILFSTANISGQSTHLEEYLWPYMHLLRTTKVDKKRT